MWGTHARAGQQHGRPASSKGFTRQPRDQRRRLPRGGAGQVLNLQLGYSHDIKFAIPEDVRSSARRRPRSRSAGPTGSGSGRSRPRSAASASPSPTRARASSTARRRSAARKARRSKRHGRSTAERTRSGAGAAGALRAQASAARVGCGCPSSARRKHIYGQVIDDAAGPHPGGRLEPRQGPEDELKTGADSEAAARSAS